ncbi:MAG: outer membrane protein assembly factor BamC [Methylococcales bacterium]|nr:outer membrane protein assembly factor BamC [Methylococcales bacterium]
MARLLISFLILITISSCGFMKDYFPDKEQDYQLKKEIPVLVIPSDLSGNKAYPFGAGFSNDKELVHEDVSNKKNDFVVSGNQTIKTVDLIKYSDKSTRLKITDTFIRSWRIVGKALSRHSIEITNRDVLKGIYFVQYDPDFKKVEDGSLWDEFLFIFGADPAKEREFRVQLVENINGTEVVVLDNSDTEASEGPGLALLNVLYESIKKDLAKKK